MRIMTNTNNTEQCMVCGSSLKYLERAEDLVCTYCGKTAPGHIKCPEGHFICDACHSKDSMTMIGAVSFTTTSQDPVEIADFMMSHPALPMLGCEHAFIAAGAFMAALKNSPYGKEKITDQDIREVFDRTEKQAVGGYCGLTGVCGIMPAMGACFSVFLGARCGSDREQRITMDAVTRVSQAITELTGPSCCKAYVRAALGVAVNIFAERFGIVLPVAKSPIICRHSGKHPHGCREEKCPYYKKEENKDIFADSIHLPVTVCHS
jgi:hypothetical protein